MCDCCMRCEIGLATRVYEDRRVDVMEADERIWVSERDGETV